MTSNDTAVTETYESDLIQHFKETIINYIVATTDYPTMFHYLLKKYKIEQFNSKNNNDSMKLYYALTHRIIPSLEKKGLLKRYKNTGGGWLFVINKEKI